MEISEELRNKSGIYRIHFGSGNFYVGSSAYLEKRLRSHLSELRRGTHHSPALQRAFNKYGEDRMLIEVIEWVEPVKEKLLEREQYWINALNCYPRGYNACPTAGSPLGRKASEVTRRLQSKLHKGVPKQGKKAKGEANIDALEYCFVNPQGEIVKGRNLSLLCETHGLYYSSMIRLISGEQIRHRGWTVPNAREDKLKTAQLKYRLQSPDGQVHEGVNVKQFAEKMGLTPEGLRRVIAGRISSHKGWTSLNGKQFQPKPVGDEFEIQSPDGVVYKSRNAAKFCKDNQLDQAAFNRVLRGLADHHKGWRLPGTSPKPRRKTGPQGRIFSFISPVGELHQTTRLSKFARDNGLSRAGLASVADGRYTSHRGWTKARQPLLTCESEPFGVR